LYFSSIDAAENMYIVAIPMSTIIVGVTLFLMANMEMMRQGTSENTMALTVSPRSPVNPRMLMSMMKNRDAPKRAPDEIPVVYGSARGLRTMYCMTAPPIPRIAPMMTHPIPRGSVPSNTRLLSR
jgi:hypothetical protein